MPSLDQVHTASELLASIVDDDDLVILNSCRRQSGSQPAGQLIKTVGVVVDGNDDGKRDARLVLGTVHLRRREPSEARLPDACDTNTRSRR